MSKRYDCPNCGKDVEALAEFCGHCGSKLKMGSYSRVFDKMTSIFPTSVPGIAAKIQFGVQTGANQDTLHEELFKLGLFNYAERNYDDAVKYWKEFAEKSPNSFEVWSCLGQVYLIQKRFTDAVNSLEKALKLNPTNPLDWERLGAAVVLEAQLTQDDDYILENIMPISIDCFEKAIKYNPSKIDLLYKVGLQYASLGKIKTAIEYVQKYLDQVPDDIEVVKILEKMQEQAMINCVECQTKNDIGFSKCINCGADLDVKVFFSTILNVAFKVKKNTNLFDAGMNSIQKRELMNGLKVFNKILRTEPNHIVVLEKMGLVYQMARQPDKAIDMFEKMLLLNKSRMIALDNLSNLYSQTSNKRGLRKTIDKIRDAGSKYSNYLTEVGNEFERDGDLNSAVKYWAKILAFEPEHEETIIKLADLIRQPQFQARVAPNIQGTIKQLIAGSFTFILKSFNVDIDKLRRIRKEEEKKFPGSAIGGRLTNKTILQLYNRAGENKTQKQYSTAISILKEALELDSSIPILYEQLGVNYHLMRDTQNAVKYLEKSIELNPYQVLAWETLAAIYHGSGRTQKADEIFKKLISFGPLYAYFMLDSGKMAFRNHFLQEAAVCWQKALMADPNNIEAQTYFQLLKDIASRR